MTTRLTTARLVLCAILLSASGAYANITNPGGANMPPAPAVTYNLGASSEATSTAGTGPIAVIQAFPHEQSLSGMDGTSKFWLGMLGLLGLTLFATGATLIAQSMTAAPAAQETVRATKSRLAPVEARRAVATV